MRRKRIACIKKPWYTEKKNESSCFVEFYMIPVLSYTALKWVLGKSITQTKKYKHIISLFDSLISTFFRNNNGISKIMS